VLSPAGNLIHHPQTRPTDNDQPQPAERMAVSPQPLPIPDFDNLIPAGASLLQLATVFSWVEVVVLIPSRKALRWSEIPSSTIYEWSSTTGQVTVYQTDVEFTNGRTLDHDGSVVQCSHGRRRIERDVDGEVTPVVEEWQGHRFNSPNDVVVASDGSIWFSDPPYGIIFPTEGHTGEREYGDHWIFRHDPSSGRTVPVVTDVEEPNGLAFSPDESVLYVADSSKLTGTKTWPGNSHVRAYDVIDGRCKNGRTFATVAVHVPDGLRVDEHGNVWVTAGDGIHVYAQTGEHLAHVPVPEVTANLCFGGADGTDLFIAASTSIYTIPTNTRDCARRGLPTG
jgi:gluconolactonase